MEMISKLRLINAIADAAGKAFSELFEKHPGEYYYCSLITSGEAHPPVPVAWSEEALETVAADEQSKQLLRWSYADSPYYCFGEEHFEEVRDLFAKLPPIEQLDDKSWAFEYDFRLSSMEMALDKLNKAGFFGRGKDRNKIVVLAEVVPPDRTNTERAKRLNPPAALKRWMEEAAEP